jgi:CheY-like chemotaxis protein
MPKRVLVVDDDPAQRRILEETIKRLGYSVTATDSGDKALLALKADPAGEICLVLLDLVMPGTDGMAVLSAMRSLPKSRRPSCRRPMAASMRPFRPCAPAPWTSW